MNNKLVIVTDLGTFKAYKSDTTPLNTPRLSLLEEIVLADGHQRLTDRVTDQAGRRGAPTLRNWGAPIMDNHNLDLEVKQRLIRQIAQNVERIARLAGHDGIWFAARPEINRQIIELLPQSLRNAIESNVPRDLVKATQAELIQWFIPSENGRKRLSRLAAPPLNR